MEPELAEQKRRKFTKEVVDNLIKLLVESTEQDRILGLEYSKIPICDGIDSNGFIKYSTDGTTTITIRILDENSDAR